MNGRIYASETRTYVRHREKVFRRSKKRNDEEPTARTSTRVADALSRRSYNNNMSNYGFELMCVDLVVFYEREEKKKKKKGTKWQSKKKRGERRTRPSVSCSIVRKLSCTMRPSVAISCNARGTTCVFAGFISLRIFIYIQSLTIYI